MKGNAKGQALAMTDTDTEAAFELGPFIIETERSIVRIEDDEHRLEPKVMAVLRLLAEADGRVVSRTDLIDQVWGVEHGADESLTRAISLLRATFRQAAPNIEFIETVPRKGYRLCQTPRFDAETEPDSAATMQVQTAIDAPTSSPVTAPEANPTQPLPVKEPPSTKALIATCAVLASIIVWMLISDRFAPAPSVETASVAVLPFEDLSPEGDRSYFAVGVADEIRSRLSQFDGLSVIGRSSSMATARAERSASDTGADLGVSFLLDGSVRWAGDRALVTSQLTRVSDGTVLWSRAYDRNMMAEDLVAIQNDIADEVAGAFSVAFDLELDANTRRRLEGTGTNSLTAYDLYQRARFQENGLPNEEAIPLLRQAVEEDPDYAAAWSLLGLRIGAQQWQSRTSEEAQAFSEEALRLTQLAIEIDPDSAEARSFYGGMLTANKAFVAAEEQHRTAISLGANSASLIQYVRMLQRTGRITSALVPFNEAKRLEPFRRFLDMESELMRQAGRYDPARTALDQYVDSDFSAFRWAFERWLIEANASGRSDQAFAYFRSARSAATTEAAQMFDIVLDNVDTPQSALAALRNEFERSGDHYPAKLLHIALFAAWLDDPELALEAFVTELDGSTVRMTYLWDALLSDMRQLPDFKPLVEEVGLVAYWREYGWADVCRPIGDNDFECV